jgi:hypothetical protein
MTLRLDAKGDLAKLVIPKGTSIREGLAFAEKEKHWLTARMGEKAAPVCFEDGAQIPLFGGPHQIRHLPDAKRGVWLEGNVIWVSGKSEHLSRRVLDFLTRVARTEVVSLVRSKAEQIDKKPGRIAIRDTSSRWGSCSSKGDLNFSWRLVLAPPFVLDYVVAHEVAHLVEHNHSPRFWRLTESMSEHVEAANRWLKQNGRDLWRYG